VAEFLQRLKTVLHTFESHPIAATATSTEDSSSEALTATDLSTQLQPYLTHSRLLPIQLTDPALRTIMLTQFWIVAHHLMSQVPPLRAQLQCHLDTAQKLLPPSQLKFLSSSAVLETSEPQWRTWKQNKCQPDLEQKNAVTAAVLNRHRKRLRRSTDNDHDEEKAYEWSGQDLPAVSQKMRSSAPTTAAHLEDYVDALDPDAGIEPEYHPKNNAVYSWRGLRLLSDSHLQDFDALHPSGDFEGMVRTVWQRDSAVDIPGEPPVPYQEEESSDEEEKETQQDDVEMADRGEEEKQDEQNEEMEVETESQNDDEPKEDSSLQPEKEEDAATTTAAAAAADVVVHGPVEKEQNGHSHVSSSSKPDDKRTGGGSSSRSPSTHRQPHQQPQEDGRSQQHRSEGGGGGSRGRPGNDHRPHNNDRRDNIDRRGGSGGDRRSGSGGDHRSGVGDDRGRADDRGQYRDGGGRGGGHREGGGPGRGGGGGGHRGPPPRDYGRRDDSRRRGGGGSRRRDR